MLVAIAVFVVLNTLYFINKAMGDMRIWLLRSLSPEARHTLMVSLSYVGLKWLLFPDFRTKEEIEEDERQRILNLNGKPKNCK